MENLGTTDHYANDAAGTPIDVVLNGVRGTHHEFDAANQVLGSVYDVAGNVMSDTSRFAVDDCLAVRCTSSNIVLVWKLRASRATAQTQAYTVTWHNANPTAMNDRHYVYLVWDAFAGNSLASSYTLPTCTTTVANYSVQVMGSPDYVGAAHQVHDGTLLDLDVSADFLRDTVAVGGRYVVGVIILRGGYAMGGVIVRCEVAVVNMILHYAVTVGGAFAVRWVM